MWISTIVGLSILTSGAILYGRSRWRKRTADLEERLNLGRVMTSPAVFSERELEGLPIPVQRYFRAVLNSGQPMIAATFLEQTGTFNMSESGDRWKRFTSKQHVVTRRAGFVWDARIPLFSGLGIDVHDAYVAGEGILEASVLGLFTMAEMRGTAEVAKGELMRFLAEGPLYPTVLLPSQGVRWDEVDDTSARATLSDGGTTVTLLFRFNEAGLIASTRAEARGRAVGKKVIPTPWEGQWFRYERQNGMLIPVEGEVAWLTSEGRKPYWRGRITNIQYGFLSPAR